ncbi:hypothetical protein GCM10010517_45910 [Streptosporangium fragile]|uniref:Uncharacterized protein n=1 Tax=Streptosporangium fragile TaxID=46186 RepID=A0ABP6IH21_9ACTN
MADASTGATGFPGSGAAAPGSVPARTATAHVVPRSGPPRPAPRPERPERSGRSERPDQFEHPEQCEQKAAVIS